MDGFKLKVSTQEMKGRSSEVLNQIRAIRTKWSALQTVINNSASYWQGEASDYHRKMLKKQLNDIEIVLKRLSEHPTDLQKMAGVYEEGESELETTALQLPENIIE